jgi:hypothetical protein
MAAERAIAFDAVSPGNVTAVVRFVMTLNSGLVDVTTSPQSGPRLKSLSTPGCYGAMVAFASVWYALIAASAVPAARRPF